MSFRWRACRILCWWTTSLVSVSNDLPPQPPHVVGSVTLCAIPSCSNGRRQDAGGPFPADSCLTHVCVCAQTAFVLRPGQEEIRSGAGPAFATSLVAQGKPLLSSCSTCNPHAPCTSTVRWQLGFTQSYNQCTSQNLDV